MARSVKPATYRTTRTRRSPHKETMRARRSRAPDAFSSRSKLRRTVIRTLRDHDRLRRRSISQPPEILLRLRAMTISRTRRITRMLRGEYLSSEEGCLQLRLRPMMARRIAVSPPGLPPVIAIRTPTTPTMARRTWTTRVVLFRHLNKGTMPARVPGVTSAFSSRGKPRRIPDPSPRDRDRLRRRLISQPSKIMLRLQAVTICRTWRMTRPLQLDLLVNNEECLRLRLRTTTFRRGATRTTSLPLATAIRTPTIRTPARQIWAAVRIVPFRLQGLERLAQQAWADQQRRIRTVLTPLLRQTRIKPSTLAAPLLPVRTRATSTLRPAQHRQTAASRSIQARSEHSHRMVTTQTSRRIRLSILVQPRALRWIPIMRTMPATLLRDLRAIREMLAPTGSRPARAGGSAAVRIRTQAITLPIQTRINSRISVKRPRLMLLGNAEPVVQTLQVAAEIPLSLRLQTTVTTVTTVTTLREISPETEALIRPVAPSEQVAMLKIRMLTRTAQRTKTVRCSGI